MHPINKLSQELKVKSSRQKSSTFHLLIGNIREVATILQAEALMGWTKKNGEEKARYAD